MEAPVPHIAMDRSGLERVDTVNQVVLDTQLRTTSSVQASPRGSHARRKLPLSTRRKNAEKLVRFSLVGMNDFGHWNRTTRASRDPCDFKCPLPRLPDLIRLAE